MPPLRNQRREAFCVALIAGQTILAAALAAGYSRKRAQVTGSELVRNSKIQARLAELRAPTTTAAVMTLQQRKERLSEIARAKLTDFMELGQDGSWVNIGPETPHGAAIAEIHSRTEYDANGAHPTVYTSVKLHDPLKAIAELNKLDGAYAPVKVDIRQVVLQMAAEFGVTEAEVLAEAERMLSAKPALPLPTEAGKKAAE